MSKPYLVQVHEVGDKFCVSIDNKTFKQENLFPVELTKSVVEKLGFRHKIGGLYEKRVGASMTLEYNPTNNFAYLSSRVYVIKRVYLQNLHEMQQLLREHKLVEDANKLKFEIYE